MRSFSTPTSVSLLARCAPFAIVLLLLPAFGAFLQHDPSGSVQAAPSDDDRAKWTFLVYLDADNNLEAYGIDDMNEMELIGSTAKLNIVVQIDRATAASAGEENDDTSNGDWTGTKRYYVTKDMDAEVIDSRELADLDEANMGDPAVLTDFLCWGIEKYPAEHYALVLWDHGGAFWGVCWDDTSNDGEGDAITMPELRTALDDAYEQTGTKLDLIAFDACLMAELAVLYEIKNYADIACASGYVVPGNGWPYDKILTHLAADPNLTPEQFATIICDEYVQDYTDRESDNAFAVTMTAFDLTAIDRLAMRVDALAMELAENARVHNVQVRLARSRTSSYDMVHVGPFDFTGYCMYDVIDFADNAQSLIPGDAGVRTTVAAVKAAVADAIIVAGVDAFHQTSGAHGLTLYFPSGSDPAAEFRTEYDPRFDELLFAKERYWDDFLHLYHDLENAGNTPPSVVIDEPTVGATIDAAAGPVRITGLAFDVQNGPQVHVAVVKVGSQFEEDAWQTASVSSPDAGEVEWQYTLDVSDRDGDYLLMVRAKDHDGVYSQTLTRTFSINAPPSQPAPIDTGLALMIMTALLAIVVFAALIVNAWKKAQ